jgi:hypothetical protein
MTVDEMVHLRVTLNGCTISWLKNFFEQGGLVYLLRNLIDLEKKFQLTKKSEKDMQIQLEILRCLQAMLKTKVRETTLHSLTNGGLTLSVLSLSHFLILSLLSHFVSILFSAFSLM